MHHCWAPLHAAPAAPLGHAHQGVLLAACELLCDLQRLLQASEKLQQPA